MRRALTVTMLSLALLPAALLTARTAEACSCIAPPPPVEAARNADAVFHAKLVSVADVPKTGPHALGNKMFTFEVVRTFKGQLDAQVNIMTTDNSAACGREYGAPGSEWLIYATIDGKGQTHDNLCSRTKPIADAASDIAELEAAEGTLDQPNEPPIEPGPSDPEPEPLPPEPTEGPEPAEPSKKGCSVSDTEPAPLRLLGMFGLFGMLGMTSIGHARRRR
jgi:Tissue inhibitor of metalloproteinase